MSGTKPLDPLYGPIQLPCLVKKFVDTWEFQRLRFIRQLGNAHFVFMGATHTRFNHCLGVCHLAGVVLRNLQKEQPELELDDRTIELVQLGAALHDVGHSAFSHMMEDFLSSYPEVTSTNMDDHEHRGLQVLRHMATKHKIEIDLDREIPFVGRVILGYREKSESDVAASAGASASDGKSEKKAKDKLDKKYLLQLVCNNHHHVDLDKLDYLVRDSFHTGVGTSVQTAYILQNIRVVDDELCFTTKAMMAIDTMFHVRRQFYRDVYCHHTVVAADMMLQRLLTLGGPFLGLVEQFTATSSSSAAAAASASDAVPVPPCCMQWLDLLDDVIIGKLRELRNKLMLSKSNHQSSSSSGDVCSMMSKQDQEEFCMVAERFFSHNFYSVRPVSPPPTLSTTATFEDGESTPAASTNAARGEESKIISVVRRRIGLKMHNPELVDQNRKLISASGAPFASHGIYDALSRVPFVVRNKTCGEWQRVPTEQMYHLYIGDQQQTLEYVVRMEKKSKNTMVSKSS